MTCAALAVQASRQQPPALAAVAITLAQSPPQAPAPTPARPQAYLW